MSRQVLLMLGMLAVAGCHGGPRPRSAESFDQIAARVVTLSASEVAATLGEPDSRQPIFLSDERWIWWNYTFLAGEDYPPEARGQVVHLEITFRNPSARDGARSPYSEWRVARPFGVSYRTPGGGIPAPQTLPAAARYRG